MPGEGFTAVLRLVGFCIMFHGDNLTMSTNDAIGTSHIFPDAVIMPFIMRVGRTTCRDRIFSALVLMPLALVNG